MQSGNNNRLTVDTAAARDKMNAMNYEIANELGVDLNYGYNGELTSKESGYVGGYMVKRMIEEMERSMANK